MSNVIQNGNELGNHPSTRGEDIANMKWTDTFAVDVDGYDVVVDSIVGSGKVRRIRQVWDFSHSSECRRRRFSGRLGRNCFFFGFC